jgi:hypothetical protein
MLKMYKAVKRRTARARDEPVLPAQPSDEEVAHMDSIMQVKRAMSCVVCRQMDCMRVCASCLALPPPPRQAQQIAQCCLVSLA